MAIAALATGCEQGFLYVRARVPARARAAAERDRPGPTPGCSATTSGLGPLRHRAARGAGAYVCGEETALFQSIEGYRGEPRNKPPFPVEVGLFGKPTVVNNVETLVNVLAHPAMAARRTRDRHADSTGTRLFCVSGHVARPGLYEIAVRHDAPRAARARGRRGEPPKAVLLGGAAGSFVRPDQLDLPLTFEDARDAGATLGSGVVIVYDERPISSTPCSRIAEFFRDESCGQCVPCRVGTVRQEEALHRLASGARRTGTSSRCSPTLGAGDARRVDLRSRPDGGERRRVGDRATSECSRE